MGRAISSVHLISAPDRPARKQMYVPLFPSFINSWSIGRIWKEKLDQIIRSFSEKERNIFKWNLLELFFFITDHIFLKNLWFEPSTFQIGISNKNAGKHEFECYRLQLVWLQLIKDVGTQSGHFFVQKLWIFSLLPLARN